MWKVLGHMFPTPNCHSFSPLPFCWSSSTPQLHLRPYVSPSDDASSEALPVWDQTAATSCQIQHAAGVVPDDSHLEKWPHHKRAFPQSGRITSKRSLPCYRVCTQRRSHTNIQGYRSSLLPSEKKPSPRTFCSVFTLRLQDSPGLHFPHDS